MRPEDLTQDKVTSQAFRIGVHEAFHILGQAEPVWQQASRRAPRGTFVPIAIEPRYERAMLFRNLVKALQDQEPYQQNDLAKAKYWFEKWKSEFPEEVEASTDRIEGSARYVDETSWALAQNSCSGNDDKLVETAAKNIAATPLDELSGIKFMLDREGYAIGSASGLLLNKINKNRNWTAQVAAGSNSVELLLSGVTAKIENDDASFKMGFSSTQLRTQAKVDETLGSTYSLLRGSDMTFVSLPFSWFMNSNGHNAVHIQGAYIDTALKINFNVGGDSVHYASSDQESNVTASANAVSMMGQGLSSPCDIPNQPAFYFVVAKGEVTTTESGTATLDSPLLKGTLKIKKGRDSKGHDWVCGFE